MQPLPVAEFDIEAIKQLLLDMAQGRSVDAVLRLVVDRLAALPNVALARIWLVRPGDLCESCSMRPECPDQTECLHLVASAGTSIAVDGITWNRLDGAFRRFPLGVRKVGRIGASGIPIEVADAQLEENWFVRPEWASDEEIRGFGGQPLIHQGQVLGVLGVFARICMVEENLTWLRMIADHVAVALANARAFEEIGRLKKRLEMENEYLREEVCEARGFGEIIGRSAVLQTTLAQVELVAPAETTVLINGESGTGKELIARAIHQRSRRKSAMVTVNCASIPRELFESEFFGHVRGSFTGAVRDRVGRFQLADRGTLFLDEVGEIPLDLQSKLLRVLQEGTFERIGDEHTRKVDVRVIAATNRDLKREVEAGRFREDLYYRLSVFPIQAAPLRERLEDVPLLVGHFLKEASTRMGIPEPKLKRRHVEALQGYDWPGNIRELQNVLERAVITAQSGNLAFDLPAPQSPATVKQTGPGNPGILSSQEMKQREIENLVAALDATNWKISGTGGAAELLGIKPTTLSSRMKSLGLTR